MERDESRRRKADAAVDGAAPPSIVALHQTITPMKTPVIPALLLAFALLPAGCQKDESQPVAAAPAVDTSKSESVFASAEASVKAGYDKVATAIRNTDWSAATTAIQDLSANAKLSDEQKASLKTLSEDIKAKAAIATAQAKEKAAQLAEDAKKAGANAVDEAGKLAEKAKEATTKAANDAGKAVSDLLPKK